jgi:NADH:ubiquinone oxidoreductase subunit 3 (subunit A)
MKSPVMIACMLVLCACSVAPTMQSSINADPFSSGPTSVRDSRLQHPQYYMTESDSMPWLRADAPRTNR